MGSVFQHDTEFEMVASRKEVPGLSLDCEPVGS